MGLIADRRIEGSSGVFDKFNCEFRRWCSFLSIEVLLEIFSGLFDT